LHSPLDLGIGDAWISNGDEPNDGDERGKTGPIVHLCLRTLAVLSLPSSRTEPVVAPGRSDNRPVLDFLLLAAELFNFEFELYRTASVTFSEGFFLFYVSVDEQVLYIGYPVPSFVSAIFALLHCQSPSKHF
jgi:hypothetical protein